MFHIFFFNNNITRIDLGECETLLRNFYNISINNSLYKNLVKLPENKMISILFKFNLKEIAKTEIFIGNEKIEIS